MKFEKKESDRYGLLYGDLIICEGGEPGRCAIWRNEVPNMKIQKALHRVRVFEEYNNAFLYYKFLLAGKNKEIDKYFIGSTIKHLTGSSLKQVEFAFPSLVEQQKIASVLSSLDAKIECNRRINAELEAMAKTLYDYWFVQFNFPYDFAEGKPAPGGQPYKSSGGPMVWSEELKREIPQGWGDGKMGDLGQIIGGSTPQRDMDAYFCSDGSGTPWITPKDLSLNSGNKFITRGEADVTKEGLRAASLTVMPKGTILLSSRAPIGYLAISRQEVTTNQGFKSFIPLTKYSTEFVYYAIQSMIPVIEQNSSGSTFKEVSGSVLKGITTLLPDTDVVQLFTGLVKNIFERQDKAELENQSLSSLRDWLLPMLMNGQVEVG